MVEYEQIIALLKKLSNKEENTDDTVNMIRELCTSTFVKDGKLQIENMSSFRKATLGSFNSLNMANGAMRIAVSYNGYAVEFFTDKGM